MAARRQNRSHFYILSSSTLSIGHHRCEILSIREEVYYNRGRIVKIQQQKGTSSNLPPPKIRRKRCSYKRSLLYFISAPTKSAQMKTSLFYRKSIPQFADNSFAHSFLFHPLSFSIYIQKLRSKSSIGNRNLRCIFTFYRMPIPTIVR